jgi:hypothetical protein
MRRRGVLRVLFRFALLGSDDFWLPGVPLVQDSYLIRCPEDHYTYVSRKWVRGGTCPECYRVLEVKDLSGYLVWCPTGHYIDVFPQRVQGTCLKCGRVLEVRQIP